MEKTIYLIRHAHIETKGTMVGRFDLPLSEKGKRQVEPLKEEVKNLLRSTSFYEENPNCHINELAACFQNIYVSPLLRATQTAQMLLYSPVMSYRPSFTIMECLKEIHLGDWEGMKKEEVINHYPELWRKRGLDFTHVAPPNGENFLQLQKRVLDGFSPLVENMHGNLPILIIAHQAVNRVILGHFKGLSLENIQSISQEYASVSSITVQG